MSNVVTEVEKKVFYDGSMRLRMCNEHGYVIKILFIRDEEAAVGMDEAQMDKLWLKHQALMAERTRIVTNKATFWEWEETVSKEEHDLIQCQMQYERECGACRGRGCAYCDGYGFDPDQEKHVSDYEEAYDAVMKGRDENDYNAYKFENVT